MTRQAYEIILKAAMREQRIADKFPTIHWLEDHDATKALGFNYKATGWTPRKLTHEDVLNRPDFLGLFSEGDLCPCFAVPRPKNLGLLFIGLHEIGHVVMGDYGDGWVPYGRPAKELRASTWARDYLAAHGITVPDTLWCIAKDSGEFGEECKAAELEAAYVEWPELRGGGFAINDQIAMLLQALRRSSIV